MFLYILLILNALFAIHGFRDGGNTGVAVFNTFVALYIVFVIVLKKAQGWTGRVK
jgi:hypothetical protein